MIGWHRERSTAAGNVLLRLALMLAALTPGVAAAQEERAEISIGLATAALEDARPWTGEQVTLNLDLETPALSFANVQFSLPDVEGALVLQTDSTTVKLSNRRGTETWQVLRYPITLFPQRAGTLVVPSFEVRFETTNGFGTTAVPHRLETTPLEIEVRQPPGVAAGQVVVTTPRMKVDSDWKLPESPLKPGDAVTLTVDREATALSAMLLPPLPVTEVPGLAAYPADPDIEDRTNRGSLTGVRSDRITWIVEQAGEFTLPDVVFRSWNPAQEQLESYRVPGVSFSAEPGPGVASTTPGSPEAPNPYRSATTPWAWLLGALLATAAGIAGWTYRSWLLAMLAAARVRILPPARALLKTLNPGASS